MELSVRKEKQEMVNAVFASTWPKNNCPKCHQGKIHDRTDDFRTPNEGEIVKIDGCRICGYLVFPGGNGTSKDYEGLSDGKD
jgi:hypothetical protein